MGWGASGLPGWLDGLLDDFAAAGRLDGHGVSFSLLSTHPRQDAWLDRLADELARRPYRRVSEHVGFMAAGAFHRGSPLPMPHHPEVVDHGRRQLARLADRVGAPVGLENLATSLTLADATGQGALVDDLLGPLDGWMVLDLHNLWCQAVNLGLDPVALLAEQPVDRVRELHVSGGSWWSPPGRERRDPPGHPRRPGARRGPGPAAGRPRAPVPASTPWSSSASAPPSATRRTTRASGRTSARSGPSAGRPRERTTGDLRPLPGPGPGRRSPTGRPRRRSRASPASWRPTRTSGPGWTAGTPTWWPWPGSWWPPGADVRPSLTSRFGPFGPAVTVATVEGRPATSSRSWCRSTSSRTASGTRLPDDATWPGAEATRRWVDRGSSSGSTPGPDGRPGSTGSCAAIRRSRRCSARPPTSIEAEPDLFADATARGDELGLHIHGWRRAPGGGWVDDFGDAAWFDECIDRSVVAFAEAFGQPCRVVSAGNRFLEPGGHRPASSTTASPSTRPASPPRPGVSTAPGPRARHHPRLPPHAPSPPPRSAPGLVELPLTAARKRLGLSPKAHLSRMRRHGVRRAPRPPRAARAAGTSPGDELRRARGRALAAARPARTSPSPSAPTGSSMPSSTLAWSGTSTSCWPCPEADRFAFVTPSEAVETLGVH